MQRVTQALRMASASPAAVEDGQESIRKLAFAPLAFLSLSANATQLATILASAVCFLEGYCASDMETDINLVHRTPGELVAHAELKLVPYSIHRAPAAVPKHHTVPLPLQTSSSTTLSPVSHQLSISHVVEADGPRPLSVDDKTDLCRFQRSFISGTAAADAAADDLLCTTQSVEVARQVLRFSAQTGLTIPRATLEALLERTRHREAAFARRVHDEFAFEVNLAPLRDAGLLHLQSLSQKPASSSRRKGSKLERMRRSSSSKP